MAQSLPSVSAHGGLTRYLEEIRQFPMLEPQEEYMLAKSWREHGDRDAAHRLVTSHLRLVARIAMGYRGYGLPIGEVVSEGNVGLMQAVKRFDPDKGFRLATYAMWWIRAAIQEYILRSWSLVKMGTTAAQKKLFFNLRKIKGQLKALDEGDLRPDQVKRIATQLGVTEEDVVSMNRRLAGDSSLNAPVRNDSESGEWQDWLVDDTMDQETALAESEEAERRRGMLTDALQGLNERERRIIGFSEGEFRLLAVHLKASCNRDPLTEDRDDCRILQRQVPVLEDWIDRRARERAAFGVVGDFNRRFDRERSAARDERGAIAAIWPEIDDGDPPGADLVNPGVDHGAVACNNGHGERMPIDYLILGERLAARLVPGSFRVWDYPDGGRWPDHCVISIGIRRES